MPRPIADKPVSLTIWTDFEVPSTSRFVTAGAAFNRGDDALLNLGCSRYVVQFDNAAASIKRRRVYRNGKWALSEYYTADTAAEG